MGHLHCPNNLSVVKKEFLPHDCVSDIGRSCGSSDIDVSFSPPVLTARSEAAAVIFHMLLLSLRMSASWRTCSVATRMMLMPASHYNSDSCYDPLQAVYSFSTCCLHKVRHQAAHSRTLSMHAASFTSHTCEQNKTFCVLVK